jgi:hypothetical protein
VSVRDDLPEWGLHVSDPLTIRDDAGQPVAYVLTSARDARLMAAAPGLLGQLEYIVDKLAREGMFSEKDREEHAAWLAETKRRIGQ